MSDAPDFEAVTSIQQQVWSAGDFAKVGALVAPVSENLAEAVDMSPGDRVLDVACGSGNAAIAAARRTWGDVVGLDFVPALLAHARERAAAEGMKIEFVEGDAQKLPFDDGSFDTVLSVFGAMFAPDQEQTAAELLRVCRPDGRIGMCNWTPDGFVGDMFKTTAKHAPPPPGLTPPVAWGTEERLRELFGDGISELSCERRTFRQRFLSTDHFIAFFKEWFGPTKMAFARVGEEGAAALEDDYRALIARHDVGGDRGMLAEAEYLEVVATRA
jgi:SAM-dependent methyltransferase